VDKTAEIMKEAGVLEEWIASNCDAEVRALNKDFETGKIDVREFMAKSSDILEKRYTKLLEAFKNQEMTKKLNEEFLKAFPPPAKPEVKAAE